ncbi:thiamine pyrophosphokinase [Pedobacter roseus]|jgi:thiamine pyrophosphokinase|uniref:Thiamine pyrophosphokinase n=1 Tax=Pedobacter roseus TaxID=336820 RepID=A0A7G9QDY8_9SPHI|nr:thiamine pyrophosphokinase [Pedobacter roseus]QNN41563.1 thiamine pyrophosphokinase [Pedobacter roseus]
MSSHHIVKEKQEPALFIEELGNFNEELLGQLLEWSPTLLVNAENYDKILSLGLKVDVLVNGTQTETQENTKVIQGPVDALMVAINYLYEEKYPAVNVITRKFDLEKYAGFEDKINIVVFTEMAKHYPIKSGFSVWKPAGSEFLIHGNRYLEVTNLMQDEDEIFKVVNDGFVEFTFSGQPIFISEPI